MPESLLEDLRTLKAQEVAWQPQLHPSMRVRNSQAGYTAEGSLSVQVCAVCATLLAPLLAPSKQNSSDTRGYYL